MFVLFYSAQLTKQNYRVLKLFSPSSHQFSSGFVEVNPNSKISHNADTVSGSTPNTLPQLPI